MELTEKNQTYLIKQVVLIVLALAICGFCWWFSSSQQLADLSDFVTKELDAMKGTVLQLTAISSVSSTALTLIPGDVATPLAENLADISDYLILVFGGIWLQKYLFSSMSILALRFIIPLGLILNIIPLVCQTFKLDNHFLYHLRRIGNKVALFGAVVFIVVPTTVYITNAIETSYESTLNQTIEHADQLNLQASEAAKETDKKEEQKEAPKDLVGQVADAITGTVDGVVDWTTGTIDAVSGTVSELPSQMIQLLNDLIDSVAILIVVNCIAPLLVFAFLVWLAKLLFGIQTSPLEASLGRFKPVGNFVRGRNRKKQIEDSLTDL